MKMIQHPALSMLQRGVNFNNETCKIIMLVDISWPLFRLVSSTGGRNGHQCAKQFDSVNKLDEWLVIVKPGCDAAS